VSCDLLLIHPPAYGEFSPPLGIATLSGFLKANGMSVKALDYNIDFYASVPAELRRAWKFYESMALWTEPDVYASEIRPHFKSFAKRVIRDIMLNDPKYVGISVLATGEQATYDLIDTIREHLGPEQKIIVGGPQIDKQQVDRYLEKGIFCAFHGEAEQALLKLLEQSREEAGPRLRELPSVSFLEDGKLVHTGVPLALKELDALPFPDFSDFKLDSYAFREPLLPIATSRGCIAKCTFCGETNYFDRFRQLSAKRIMAEIRHGVEKYGVGVFRLNDSLINGNPRVLESWIDELLESGVKIVFGGAQARITDKMTPTLLAKMKKAGCHLIQYGVETGSDRLMAIMRKGIRAKVAREVIHRTKQAGIRVQINIIAGHPRETLTDFLKTLAFVYRVRKQIDNVNLSLYSFDKFSYDTAHEKDITDRFSKRWKGSSWQHTYPVRRSKEILLVGLLRASGVRRT
jgi:radical SAM superfamily enzyme YgiQ (UPF0313 family)